MREPAGRLLIFAAVALALVAVAAVEAAAAGRHASAAGRLRHVPSQEAAAAGGGYADYSRSRRGSRYGGARRSRPTPSLRAETGAGAQGIRPVNPPSRPTSPGTPSSTATGEFKIPNTAIEPLEWADLDGWTDDDHKSAMTTFQASCRPIVRSSFVNDARPVRTALQSVCARAVAAKSLDREGARAFFEANFRPVHIRKLGDAAGFLTGYYEPIVDGSRFPTREFTVPIYRRPPDLVAAGATKPGGPFPNSGRAFRLTENGTLVPYYDRGEIEDGALDGRHLEICWVRNATEALFIQIEGSARIRLEDGTLLRINYDAHNGYPYVPVGRVLIERNLVPREEMSMQRIRDWMRDNPDQAKDVRRQNRSVVFFRIVGLNDDREALGAQGIPLSAGRSIAVDKALHVYGTPFFIEADLPPASGPQIAHFRRTMIAQDTGSAIVGPARADLYFGAGNEAGQIAGRIRQPGRFAMLLPREIDLAAVAASIPLPPEKPALPPVRLAAYDRERDRMDRNHREHDRGERDHAEHERAGHERAEHRPVNLAAARLNLHHLAHGPRR
jgi:membrane-bound lytic murein transglycosylase A